MVENVTKVYECDNLFRHSVLDTPSNKFSFQEVKNTPEDVLKHFSYDGKTMP